MSQAAEQPIAASEIPAPKKERKVIEAQLAQAKKEEDKIAASKPKGGGAKPKTGGGGCGCNRNDPLCDCL